MQELVSIVMPAYRARDTIKGAVESVLAQTYRHWELVIASDDGEDYAGMLAEAGITDPRIVHVSTGGVGTGSSNARNTGLAAATGRLGAILDADDLMHPEKLDRAVERVRDHGVVSTGLHVVDAHHRPLRTVGLGHNGVLQAGRYKFINFSMDSMLVYDRDRCDPRYDPGQPCLVDLDFVLKLLAASPAVFHIGLPLHTYVKQPMSISNGPGFAARMIAMKKLILKRLAEGYYRLADPRGVAGFSDFLTRSLAAEKAYGVALATNPAWLFEDEIEPRLSP